MEPPVLFDHCHFRGCDVELEEQRLGLLDQLCYCRYVLTVCDNAKESCPVFFGKATRLHHSFNDPAAVEGSEEKQLGAFRKVRDELRVYLKGFPR